MPKPVPTSKDEQPSDLAFRQDSVYTPLEVHVACQPALGKRGGLWTNPPDSERKFEPSCGMWDTGSFDIIIKTAKEVY